MFALFFEGEKYFLKSSIFCEINFIRSEITENIVSPISSSSKSTNLYGAKFLIEAQLLSFKFS